jgi:hypothetical protein
MNVKQLESKINRLEKYLMNESVNMPDNSEERIYNMSDMNASGQLDSENLR